MEDNCLGCWSIWIDEANKVLSTKQIPNSREIYFESKEFAIETIHKLVTKGFKIG